MSAEKIKKLEARIEKLEKDLKSERSRKSESSNFKSVFGSDGDIGTIKELTEALNKQYKTAEDTLTNISSKGAFFVKGGPLQEGMEASIREMNLLLGESEKGAQSFEALALGIKNFQQIAKATEGVAGNLASTLSTQAGVLRELGLSYGTFSKNVDFAIYSMGASKSEVEGLNLSLMNLSKQVGMLPDTVSQNFQTVSKTLAYNFSTIRDEFVKIQRLSSETGVSIDNLMGKFGAPMDTISGASQMAAKLNSLLGRNRFSATELLMMKEEDRMTSIRGALMESGVANTALQGDIQGKFALQSVNEVLGLGVDQTRRFLQTGGLKEEVSEKVGQDFTSTAFSGELDNSTTALEGFRMKILDLMDPLRAQAILIRENELRSGRGKSVVGQGAISLGAITDLGAFAADYGPDVLAAAQKSESFRKAITTFSRAELEDKRIKPEELAKKINQASTAAEGATIGARALSGKDLKRANLEKLNQTDQAIFNALMEIPGAKNFGIRERAAIFLREDSDLESLTPEAAAGELFEKLEGKIPEELKEKLNKIKNNNSPSAPAKPGVITGGQAGTQTRVLNLTQQFVVDGKVLAEIVSHHQLNPP